MKFLKKLIILFGISILMLVLSNKVFAKELTIVNSDVYNKGLDLYTNTYFDTLIQDNIVNATCDWSNYGCAIQVPIREDQSMNSNQRYKISVLVSVPHNVKVIEPNFGKNLSFYKGNSSESGYEKTSLWRLYNYDLSSNYVFNSDMTITYQSTSNNIDIYLIDYSFKAKSSFTFDIVSIAFALNSSNSIQTGTLKFSYLMLDATNEDIVNAVKNVQQDIKNLQTDVKTVDKTLKDESVPTFNQDKFLGYLPDNPISNILNMPLNIMNSLINILGSDSCQSLNVPLPFVNQSVPLPCVSTQLKKIGVWNLYNSTCIIICAFWLYKYFIFLYNWVDQTLTLRENTWQGYEDI